MKDQILICTAIMLNDHSNPYIESTTVLSDMYRKIMLFVRLGGLAPARPIILVKCLALWGERERSDRHYSNQYTVQHSVQQPGRTLVSIFCTEHKNADKIWLDREYCLGHLVASVGESWYPGALSWRLRSFSWFYYVGIT